MSAELAMAVQYALDHVIGTGQLQLVGAAIAKGFAEEMARQKQGEKNSVAIAQQQEDQRPDAVAQDAQPLLPEGWPIFQWKLDADPRGLLIMKYGPSDFFWSATNALDVNGGSYGCCRTLEEAIAAALAFKWPAPPRRASARHGYRRGPVLMSTREFKASDLAYLRRLEQIDNPSPAQPSTEIGPRIKNAVRRIVYTSDVPGYSREQQDRDHAPMPHVRSDERICDACGRVMPMEKTRKDLARYGGDYCRDVKQCELARARSGSR